MSIPAVLYDHVPVVDLPDDDDTQKEPTGVSYFVSKMVYRVSAPPREQDDDGEQRQQQPQSIEREREDSDNSDNGNDNGNDNDNGNEDIESDNDVERPMETIIEDLDSDYVFIPIPSSTTTVDHDEVFSVISRTEKNRIYSRLHAYGDALFKTTTRSCEWNNHSRITHFWKANGALIRSLSGFYSLQTHLLKPLQYYLKDLSSSSIYSSYDWVSETAIDGSGNRLILPGSCVALDFDDDSENCFLGNDGNGKASNRDTGTLIVPSCANSTCLKHNTTASPNIPLSSSSSSMWASNTIMVSAHDLLAVKRDQYKCREDTNMPQPLSLFDAIEEEEQQQQGRSQDYRYYYRDENSSFMVATTQNVTQQWSRALWKLTKRKTNMWYYIGYISFRRSIQNVGRLLINPQQLLIKYYKSNTIISCRSLLLSSNTGFANGECDMFIQAHDEDNRDKEGISDSIFIVPLEKRCLESFNGRQSSAQQAVNEYDGIVGSREDPFIIEMTTFMSNNQNEFLAP